MTSSRTIDTNLDCEIVRNALGFVASKTGMALAPLVPLFSTPLSRILVHRRIFQPYNGPK